ncbi:hypothetical protein MPER_04538 [Moniliophthora perniciosa FA553]|nr:hypothetical protein MPER_04538 [Moniliophthora perniciosa FA553]
MITSRFLKRLTFNHQDASPPFLPKLTKVRFIFYEDGPAKRILPKTLISRWIPDAQHALEGGIDCIKSIDIVLIAENEEPVEVLRSELQWMSSAEVQVSVAARIVEYDYYDDDFDEEDTNDDSSSDSSH